MDVIINNSPAQPFTAQPYVTQPLTTQTYAAPMPYGYTQGNEHHGPGFLLPLLLIGGFLFFRARRGSRRRQRPMWAGHQNGQQVAGQPSGTADAPYQTSSTFRQAEPEQDWGELLRRGRDRLFGQGTWEREGAGGPSATDRALEIARERYARGEIDADGYAELQRNLLQGGRAQAGKSQSGTSLDGSEAVSPG